MAIDTKPNFNSGKFEQCSGDIMNLSGCTQIYGIFDIEESATLTICENAGVGKILTSNASGIATWQAGALTAISGGSGMNFSPITTTGEIILGTPSAILNTSIDVSSGTTHIHAFSASTFVSGTQGILVDGTNKFYLDDTYISDTILPDLQTIDNVTSNQSLGSLPTGQTLGMVYITNTGSTQATVNLGTTALGNDITPFQPIDIDAGEDVSITVNMRLSLTESKTIFINSDDWTNVGLNIQWANVTFKNIPLPTGGTSYTFSDGLTESAGTVKLGGDYAAGMWFYPTAVPGNAYFGLCNNGTIDQYVEEVSSESWLNMTQVVGANPAMCIETGVAAVGACYASRFQVRKDCIRFFGCTDSRLNAEVRYDENGFKYTTDVSSKWTGGTANRYFVDKGYVDSLTGLTGLVTASNGLTAVGSDVKLGGTLTGNTTISYGSGGSSQMFFNNTSGNFDLFVVDATNTSYGNIYTYPTANSSVVALLAGDQAGKSSDLSVYNNRTVICGFGANNDFDIHFGTTGIYALQQFTGDTDCHFVQKAYVDNLAFSGGSSPSGADGAMQYNNGGTFGGTCLNWDDSLNHMGWNTIPKADAMLAMKKDVDYDSCRTMIELYTIDSGEVERSEFKICLCGAGKGADMFTHCIFGYCCGSTSANLNLNSSLSVDISATNNIILDGSSININSILKLNPITEPGSPLEGMIYYDSGLNKLRMYNGTSWETITSA